MAEVTKVAKPLLAAEKRLKHHGGKELDDIIGSYSELPESDTCSTDSEEKGVSNILKVNSTLLKVHDVTLHWPL